MRLLVILTTTVLLLGACAGTAPATAPTAASRSVRVDMSDFYFAPTVVDLNPGETVTLLFKNFGTLEHEFMAGRDAVYGEGFEDDWLAKAKPASTSGHDIGHRGEAVRIAPSSTVTVTLVVPLEAGQFEFGCFLLGITKAG